MVRALGVIMSDYDFWTEQGIDRQFEDNKIGTIADPLISGGYEVKVDFVHSQQIRNLFKRGTFAWLQ